MGLTNSQSNSYWSGKTVLVTGGAGFIGSHVVDNLIRTRSVPAAKVRAPRSAELDLRQFADCQKAVDGCNVVIHLAAATGGISFTKAYPAQQYYDSTLIDLNVIEAARRAGVSKLVAIGNLFSYAGNAVSPLREEALFDGLPTDAHRSVGWMKRNLAMVADLYYREHRFPMVVVYSANAYGPNDSLDPVKSHVIPGTIMKCFREPHLSVWGDGSPTRDFLFVEDVAEGLLCAAEALSPPGFVNIGSGREISIRDLVGLIVRETGFAGEVTFDASKGGGDARRYASIERAQALLVGFQPRVSMEDGMRRTVAWYRQYFK